MVYVPGAPLLPLDVLAELESHQSASGDLVEVDLPGLTALRLGRPELLVHHAADRAGLPRRCVGGDDLLPDDELPVLEVDVGPSCN